MIYDHKTAGTLQVMMPDEYDKFKSLNSEFILDRKDLDGNILQSSYEDKTPFTYMVGTGAVIKGWEEAVKLMRKGGKAWMLIPSKIGYGDYQRIKAIKPYSPIVFELEVIDLKK